MIPPQDLNRREFLRKSAAGLASLATFTSRTSALPESQLRPNVILITCHDLGRHLGCYGVSTVNSPHLDALAIEGVRFAESFCVAPQCSPSRAAIVTGRYPHSNGVMGLSHGNFAWSLDPDSRHIASLLKENGWYTGLAGGQHETHDPRTIGFDEMGSDGLFLPCGEVANQCVDFLMRRSRAAGVFYLQVGFHEAHRPWDYGGAEPDSSRGVTVMPYLADDEGARSEGAAIQGSVRAVDRAIGTVLNTIDRLGLRENTLLIFTTDHGIAFPRSKCSVYDPGLQTCLIMRWPGARWPVRGTAIPTVVSNIDYLPTFLDLLALPIPANVQGRSFAALLQGQPYEARDEIFAELSYHDYYDPRRCVRTLTYKLIVNFSNAYFFMDPSQEWYRHTVTKNPSDPAYAYHELLEIYDLERDPGENVNLALSSGHEAIKADLLARLRRWMDETRDPLLAGIPMSPMHERALAALEGLTT